MGGIGSGNWYRWDTRKTTNDTLSVDIRYLKKANLLRPGFNGTLTWSRGGEQIGWIRFQVLNSSLRLLYRYRQYGGEWQDADEHIAFDWIPCNYGGSRQWFLCPHCGKRVAILYGLDSGFLCRKCYRLPYACQSESKIDRLIRKRRKLDEKMGFDDGYRKPKGMHRVTYKRVYSEYIRLDNIIDRQIAIRLENLVMDS